CPQCGMPFVRGQPEDEQIHERYHRAIMGGIDYPGYKNEVNVKEVLQLVNKELGSVDFDPEQLDSCKVFLYISGRKKVIGCAIAERIKQGFCIIPSATTDANAIDGTICGINRIWVSSHHRRRKIASRLLDAIRDRFIYACKLELSDLAFSQPTGDGKALARQYLGTDRFLVYVE
ncbi:ESCO1/2 acetyl-transferase-domain-containing protein, partial [Mortierella sp. GBAus27b]